MNDEMKKYRRFLKDHLRLEMDFSKTDQNMGVQIPPLEKPFSNDDKRISLTGSDVWSGIDDTGVINAIKRRKSRRKYSGKKIKIDELSFLLWASSGIRKRLGSITLRNVPSAGNRHAIETYILVLNIDSLEPGIYRYLPFEHELLVESLSNDIAGFTEKINEATLGQSFIGRATAIFVWAAIPYRMEWRYGIASHKVIAIDAGHICQNLYLACEAIGAGTCAVAAYDQKLMDDLVGVDGEEEFTIYMAPVGKI